MSTSGPHSVILFTLRCRFEAASRHSAEAISIARFYSALQRVQKQTNIKICSFASDYLPCTVLWRSIRYLYVCANVHYCDGNGTDSAPCSKSRTRPFGCQKPVTVTSRSRWAESTSRCTPTTLRAVINSAVPDVLISYRYVRYGIECLVRTHRGTGQCPVASHRFNA